MHHAELPPSSWPALIHCGDYKSTPGTSDAAERGTDLHEYFAARLDPADPAVPVIPDDDELEVEWAVAEVKCRAGLQFMHVEEKVRLLDDQFQEVTFGFADAWCELNRATDDLHVKLFDLKTGEMTDAQPQVAAYAAALLQKTGAKYVEAHLLYSRYRKVVTHLFTPDVIAGIVEKVTTNYRDKIRTTNPFCKWCAKSTTCPAFAQEACNVATRLGYEVESFDPQALEANPGQLANALRLAKLLGAWASNIEKLAKASEDELPGFQWSLRKTKYVNSLETALTELRLQPPPQSLSRPATVAEIAKIYASQNPTTTSAARAVVENVLSGEIKVRTSRNLKESK